MKNTVDTMVAAKSDRLSRLGLLNEPAGYVDGQNLYEFVGDSPDVYTDPTGLKFENKGDSGDKPLWWVQSANQLPDTGGGHGDQAVGSVQVDIPPEIVTGKSPRGCTYAYVKAGTGIVTVIRSYAGVQAGDQGVGVAGSFYAGKRVYVSAKLSAALNAHEAGHISASEKIYDHTIKPAEDVAAKYRDRVWLVGVNGETEQQLRDKLNQLINWNASIQAFKDKDTAVNGGNGPGTFHGWEAVHGGGPVVYTGAGNVGETQYDQILKDRSETDPNYHDPDYGSYDPYAP